MALLAPCYALDINRSRNGWGANCARCTFVNTQGDANVENQFQGNAARFDDDRGHASPLLPLRRTPTTAGTPRRRATRPPQDEERRAAAFSPRRRAAEETSQGDIVVTGTLITQPEPASSSPGHGRRPGRDPAPPDATSPKSSCATFRAPPRASARPSTTATAARPSPTFAASATTATSSCSTAAHRPVQLRRPRRPEQHPAGAGRAGRHADRRRRDHLRRRRRVGRHQLHHPPATSPGMELDASSQITERGDGHIFRADADARRQFRRRPRQRGPVVGYQEADPGLSGRPQLLGQQLHLDLRRRRRLGHDRSGALHPVRRSAFEHHRSGDRRDPRPMSARPTPSTSTRTTSSRRRSSASTSSAPAITRSPTGSKSTPAACSRRTRSTRSSLRRASSAQLAVIPVSNPFLPAAARAHVLRQQRLRLQHARHPDADAGAVRRGGDRARARPTRTSGPSRPLSAAASSSSGRASPNSRRRCSTIGPASGSASPTRSVSTSSGAYGESREPAEPAGLRPRPRGSAPRSTRPARPPVTSGRRRPSRTRQPADLPPLGAARGAGTTGCVPVNLFGAAGSITPAMIPYITADAGTAAARVAGPGPGAAERRLRRLRRPGPRIRSASRSAPSIASIPAPQIADALSQTAGELGGAGGAALNVRRRLRRQGSLWRSHRADRPGPALLQTPDPRSRHPLLGLQGRCAGHARATTPPPGRRRPPGSRSTASGSAATTSARSAPRTSASCSLRR